MFQNKKLKKFIFISIFLLGVCSIFFFFKKTSDPIPVSENNLIKTTTPVKIISNTNFFYDFEKTEELIGADNIKIITAHSGKQACDLSSGQEYGPSVVKLIKDVTNDLLKLIRASIWIFPLTDNPNTVLTISVANEKNESVFWDGKSTQNNPFPKNKWTKLNAAFKLPANKFSPDDIIKINFWNKGKDKVIIDDLEIVYGENNERKGFASTIDANAINEKRFIPEKNKPPFQTLFLQKQESNIIELNSLTPNDELLADDFMNDKNNLDELLCVKNNKAMMYSFSSEKQSFELIWESSNTKDNLWNIETNLFSGDFNADGKADLLAINKKTKNWQLFNFNNKSWFLIAESNTNFVSEKWVDAKNSISVSGIFSANKTDELIITKKNKLFILTYNKINKEFEEKQIPTVAPIVFMENDKLFKVNFFSKNHLEVLKLNTDWRFDLKLIDCNNNDFTSSHTIDFVGYSNDYNPKYYEFTKIISGNFINKAKTSLLVMSYNCADKNFDGKHCTSIENIDYLPNSINIYSIDKK